MVGLHIQSSVSIYTAILVVCVIVIVNGVFHAEESDLVTFGEDSTCLIVSFYWCPFEEWQQEFLSAVKGSRIALWSSLHTLHLNSFELRQTLDVVYLAHTSRNLRLFIIIIKDVVTLELDVISLYRYQGDGVGTIRVHTIFVLGNIVAVTDDAGVILFTIDGISCPLKGPR